MSISVNNQITQRPVTTPSFSSTPETSKSEQKTNSSSLTTNEKVAVGLGLTALAAVGIYLLSKGQKGAKVLAKTQQKQQQVPGNQTTRKASRKSNKNKKFEEKKQQVRQELSAGVTPERTAQIHKEADTLQVQNRQQGREIKHIVEENSGFTTHNKQRVAPEQKGEAVVKEINKEVNKTAESILAETKRGPLSPHDAATLEDNLVNNLKTREEIELFKTRLKTRVGTDEKGRMFKYEVQGQDHAERLMAKADKKLKELADFDEILNSIPEKGGMGDMTSIKAFINRQETTTEQLTALIEKMEANPTLKKFGGTKKLISAMKTKVGKMKANVPQNTQQQVQLNSTAGAAA